MREIEFRVQGSADEPYRVMFSGSNGELTASCTCKAGSIGTSCKHKTNILLGVLDGIVSGTTAEIEQVVAWARGSKIEAAVSQLESAERKLAQAKRDVNKAKQALSDAWRGI